jgi:hypothetical protein
MLYLLTNQFGSATLPVPSGPPPANVLPTAGIRASVTSGNLTVPVTLKLEVVAQDTDGFAVSCDFKMNGVSIMGPQTGVAIRNVALDQNGGVASASSTDGGSVAALANNGDRTGIVRGGFSWWQCVGPGTWQVLFPAAPITAVNVFGLQDLWQTPSTPTLNMTGLLHLVTDMVIEYLDPATNNWAAVPGGTVSGNNKVWFRTSFAAITAAGLRVNCHRAQDNWMRLVEVEVEVATTPTLGAEVVYQITKTITVAGTYAFTADVVDDAGASVTTNTVSSTLVDPVSIPAGTSLRSQYSENALRIAAKAGSLPGVEYCEASQPDMLAFNMGLSDLGQNNFQVGRQIEWRGTLPDTYGPDTQFVRCIGKGFNPDGSTFFSKYCLHMRHLLPHDTEEMWLNYTFMFDPDAASNTTDIGWKLPGFESEQTITSWHVWSYRTHNQGPVFDEVGPLWLADTYDYKAEDSSFPGSSDQLSSPLTYYRPNQMISVDVHIKLNTPVNPATIDADTLATGGNPATQDAQLRALWNANGIQEMWINDQQVVNLSNVKWRDFPSYPILINGVPGTPPRYIDNCDFIFFNGGPSEPLPLGPMHITVGPIILSRNQRVGKLRPLSTGGGSNRRPIAGPLFDAGIPSAPGAHIAAIQAMAPGTWLDLGVAAPDPVWGGCEGRSFSGKMPYSSELGVGFRSAQGPHGFDGVEGGLTGHGIIRNGHYHWDSIFALDIYGLRWICVDPGINTETFAADVASGAIMVDPVAHFDGATHWLIYTATGRAVYAADAHQYGHAIFDIDKLTFNCTAWQDGHGGGPFSTPGNQGQPGGWFDPVTFNTLAAQPGAQDAAVRPYVFNCLTGELTRSFDEGGDYYIPTLKKSIQIYQEGTYLNGVTANATGAHPVGSNQSGNDRAIAYDPLRNKIYVGDHGDSAPGGTKSVYVYDVATNNWTNPTTSGVGDLGPQDVCITWFDERADRLLSYGNPGGNTFASLSVWDPNTQQWESQTPVTQPGMEIKKSGAAGFYAPELGVAIIHQVTDGLVSSGHIWAYKHAR